MGKTMSENDKQKQVKMISWKVINIATQSLFFQTLFSFFPK